MDGTGEARRSSFVPCWGTCQATFRRARAHLTGSHGAQVQSKPWQDHGGVATGLLFFWQNDMVKPVSWDSPGRRCKAIMGTA
jgi:hypothetical protein